MTTDAHDDRWATHHMVEGRDTDGAARAHQDGAPASSDEGGMGRHQCLADGWNLAYQESTLRPFRAAPLAQR